MSPPAFQAFHIGTQTFAALMDDALRCPCDQDGAALCVRCECLFRLAVAATEYASVVGGQQRHLVWLHQAVTRHGGRRPQKSL